MDEKIVGDNCTQGCGKIVISQEFRELELWLGQGIIEVIYMYLSVETCIQIRNCYQLRTTLLKLPRYLAIGRRHIK